jgi:hypothetical protein
VLVAAAVEDIFRVVLLCFGFGLVLATEEQVLRKAAEVVTVDRRRIEVKARAEVE